MESLRYIKLRTSKIAKKFAFPKDYKSFIRKVQDFLPLNDLSKRYQIVEENAQREILNQEDYEKMSEKNVNQNVIKISLNIVDKNAKFIIPASEKSDKNKK